MIASTPSPINQETIAAIIRIITRGDVNCSKRIFKAEFLSFDWIAFGQYNSFLIFDSFSEIQFSEVCSSFNNSAKSI
jgi:hypothetical protein